MFTEKDILTRLQNGEDAQAIADEFAKIINNANKTFIEEQQKAEAEIKAKELQETKENELASVLRKLKNWLRHYYPKYEKEIVEAFEETATKDVIDMIDSIFDLMDSLNGIDVLFKSPVAKKSAEKVASKRSKVSTDEILSNFLAEMGW